MGIFVLISSINPLRVYRFSSEILLRFCPKKYYPFDPLNIDKYVVYESHTHFSQMPSFKRYCDKYEASSKLAFEDQLRRRGFDVDDLWRRVDDAIVKLVIKNEHRLVYQVRFYF